MIMQEMVLIIPYNKHHQNQEHKKHASMLQKTDAAADRSKRDVIGDSVKEGKVQEMGTSWMPHWCQSENGSGFSVEDQVGYIA
jgi:hypothetical protein